MGGAGPMEATAPSAIPSPSSDGIGTEAAVGLRIEAWRPDGSRSLAGLDALQAVVADAASRSWVDLTDPSPELTRAVARELGLHPMVAEDIEEQNQRPKLELTGEHVHLVAFRSVYNASAQAHEVHPMLGRNLLLTARPATWDPWAAQHLREGAGPLL